MRNVACYVRVNFPLRYMKTFGQNKISFVNLDLSDEEFPFLNVGDLKQLVFVSLTQNIEQLNIGTNPNWQNEVPIFRPSLLQRLWNSRENQEMESCSNTLIGTTTKFFARTASPTSEAREDERPCIAENAQKRKMEEEKSCPILIHLPSMGAVLLSPTFSEQPKPPSESLEKDQCSQLLMNLKENWSTIGGLAYVHDPSSMRDALQKGPDQFIFKIGPENDMGPGQRWLTDDTESLTELVKELAEFQSNQVLELWLISQHKAPIPRIFCEVVSYQTSYDAYNRPFTQFIIEVRYEKMKWNVYRRYSEFRTLHHKLLQMSKGTLGCIPRKKLPVFPNKAFQLWITFQKADMDERQNELEYYLKQLTGLPESNENIEILGFLGVVSTRQEEINSRRANRAPPKLLVSLSSLAQENQLEWGDVVMFKCNNTLSRLQRQITGAEWDHIAIIIQVKMGGPLMMLESTGDGVSTWPVLQRIRAYGNEYTQYIALRKLKAKKTVEMYTKMLDFVGKVVGKPYGFSLGRILNRNQEPSPAPQSLSNGEETPQASPKLTPIRSAGTGENYFCSELVAACLQYMGVLGITRNCSSFLPGSFSTGSDLDTECTEGCSFTDEIIIDCHNLEIGNAKR